MLPNANVKRLSLSPVPPNPDLTIYFEAGAVRFGVEYRELSPEITRQLFGDDPDLNLRLQHTKDVNDSGISLHVFGAADGREYLRFDCFAEDPHYHYLLTESEARNVIVSFDTAADGDMLHWALGQLRNHLPEMLIETGAVELARQTDSALIEAVLPAVANAARAAESANP